jgi:DNA-binding NarL/FixJ family response regulator
MTAPHRIVIAEDHTILREGLRSLLSERREFSVVGEAGDGLAAIALVKELKPDLVLMDLSMPRLAGIDAIREITKHHPGTRVVALTVHKTAEYLLAARAAGALGYVLKDDSSAELLAAIRSVLAGKPYLSAAVRALLTGASPEGGSVGSGTLWDAVTARERAVMKLIAEGHRNREIAGLLGISAKTVEKHRANLMGKLAFTTPPLAPSPRGKGLF